MQSKAKTIPDYIAELPPEQQQVITLLDALIRKHAPHAVGAMTYGMSTYTIGDRGIAFNAQKNYYSLYVNPELLDAFRPRLKKLSVGKCCIRFKRLADAPLEILREIVAAYSA